MFEIKNPADYKVALLCGGNSRESEVSLNSGKGAGKALAEAGFQVSTFNPANKEDLKALVDGDFDVAFLCLHGKGGEDGSIQGFLETIGLPYTGSHVCASAIAMNKSRAKTFYREAGIPTAASVTFTKAAPLSPEEIIAQVGERCVVKDTTEGSSFGLFIVEGAEELQKAIDEVFISSNEVLVEQFIKGRELTVAVVGNEDAQAFPIIEIVPQNEFYDFESKYAPGGSKHICPAEIDEAVAAEIRDRAVRAHRALGCSGVSRSDFLLEENGNSWILETNTLPGMTETSLLPDAARAAGISFSQLCTHFIELALEK